MSDDIWRGREVLVLDGSMGDYLKSRGVDIPRDIWSAAPLLEAPDAVRRLHVDYIRAGADIITTNNYACVPSYLERRGMTERLAELVELSAQLAIEARDEAAAGSLIAGALPPLGESYRPDEVLDAAEAQPVYRLITDALTPHVDLLLCETMSSIAEARMTAEVAAAADKPVWLAWTLADDHSGRLRSGETIADAVAAVAGLDVGAYLFNCCVPESIDAALNLLGDLTDKPKGAYANAFRPVPEGRVLADGPIEYDEDMDPWTYEVHVRRWLGLGAAVVGGCCGIGPDHIQRLRMLAPRAVA